MDVVRELSKICPLRRYVKAIPKLLNMYRLEVDFISFRPALKRIKTYNEDRFL